MAIDGLDNSVGEDTRIRPEPVNPVAEFVDEYGDKQVVHRKKGRRLSVYRKGDTPVHLLNRAAAILFGKRIRERRLVLKMTQKQVALKAGLSTASPKQYLHKIETGFRAEGVRMGSLYALAYALECDPTDLLPCPKEVAKLAKVGPNDLKPLAAQ
jgi:DNA-binding Xre family transcriptional regulator